LAKFKGSEQFKKLEAGGDPDKLGRQYEQVYLAELIKRAVMEPEAKKRGIVITSEKVQERLEQIGKQFPTEADFEQALEQQGLDEAQLQKLVYDQLLEDELRTAVIMERGGPSSPELGIYYDQHMADFSVTEAQHILVKERPLADRIYRQLAAAAPDEVGALFERLAGRYSIDSGSASNGGRLQPFSPGDLDPTFEAAAAKLDPGEISRPVKTQFGWHVIRLTGRAYKPLADVKNQILQQLAGPKGEKIWTDWLHQAYASAGVRVNPRFGHFDIVSQSISDITPEDYPGSAASPSPAASPLLSPAG
jgi:foldase protein PrsA